MYDRLYKFLLRYKTLHLPGIGRIILQTEPAESRFVDQRYLPPNYSITFEPDRFLENEGDTERAPGSQQQRALPSATVFSWLAANDDITEKEAVIRFDDFVFGLKAQLNAGKKITWNGIGVLQKDATGNIAFHTYKTEAPWLEPTIAKKVIRNNAEHTILVGEAEKTSLQMTEMLSGPGQVKEKHGYWWVWPLAVIIAIFIFLGWYFSEHGISGNATGNHHKTSPAEAPK